MTREAPSLHAAVDRRWYLGAGDERCPFCLQGYALETEVRCRRCDEPGCLHCFVEVREGHGRICPACEPPAHAPDGPAPEAG